MIGRSTFSVISRQTLRQILTECELVFRKYGITADTIDIHHEDNPFGESVTRWLVSRGIGLTGEQLEEPHRDIGLTNARVAAMVIDCAVVFGSYGIAPGSLDLLKFLLDAVTQVLHYHGIECPDSWEIAWQQYLPNHQGWQDLIQGPAALAAV